jgi:hypothetical protein
MDSTRFAFLPRALSAPSRRHVSRALAGLGIMGGLGSLLRPADSEARKRKGKKKRKKCKNGKKKCGKKCIPADGCCTAAECAAGQSCCAHECTAPMSCGEDTCGCGEVCRWSPEGARSCQPGGCPEIDYCGNRTRFICDADDDTCFCATSIDGVPGCVKDPGSTGCPQCKSDADCVETLGQPALCLQDGPGCDCGGTPLCALLCTSDSALRRT